MAEFVRGTVVVVPFPFSDLSSSKLRPALVVSTLVGDDLILCQITSRTVRDEYAIQLIDNDFADGGLHQESNIRVSRLFTADSRIIKYAAGTLTSDKMNEVLHRLVALFAA